MPITHDIGRYIAEHVAAETGAVEPGLVTEAAAFEVSEAETYLPLLRT
ncbi:MAG: hypothetical protein ACLGIZ_14660 [Acidimicrobiia bacterium]